MLKRRLSLAALTFTVVGFVAGAPALAAEPAQSAAVEPAQTEPAKPVQRDDMDDRLTGRPHEDWRRREAERYLDAYTNRSFGQDSRYARVTAAFEICVEPNGTLSCLSPVEGTPPALVNRLLDTIPNWRFSAANKQGVPVSAQSYLYVTLEGERREQDKLELKVSSATVGPLATRMPPPRYPLQALMSRRSGAVLLSAQLNAAGDVLSVSEVESTGPYAMVRSAKRAVAEWRFQPEKIEGRAVASEILVPIYFHLDGQPTPKLDWVDRHSIPLEMPSASEALISVEIPEHS